MSEYRPIGQVAQDCDVTTVQLRDWEKQGLIQCDHRPNGRYFNTDEYGRIRKIRDILDDARKAGTKKTYDDVRRELFGESLVQRAEEADQQTRMEQMMQHAFDKVFDDEMKQVFLHFAKGYKAVIERNEMLERELYEIKQILAEQSKVKLALDEIAVSAQQSAVDLRDTLNNEVTDLRNELKKRNDYLDDENRQLKDQLMRVTESLNYVTRQNETMSGVMSDRDKSLMEAIRSLEDIKQTQQQIAAATEERKRGWWPFGRK